MFGMRRRTSLIKTLAEERFNLRGIDTAEARDVIKSLGTMTVMGLPEATIVTVLETGTLAQKQGVPIKFALERLERLRRAKGSDAQRYQAIVALSETNPEEAMIQYMVYRIQLEAKPVGVLTYAEVSQLASLATSVVRAW